MNWKQIIAMWCGIAAILGFAYKALLFYSDFGGGLMVFDGGYYVGYYEDFMVLVFSVALVTGGLMVTLADKKTKEQRKQSMNWKQIIAMWCGIAAIVCFVAKEHIYFCDGEFYFFDKCGDADFWIAVFSVALVTGGLIVTLADKKDKKPKDQQKE